MTGDKGVAIADFIRQKIAKNQARPISGETPLISSGLVDSLSLVTLLTFIEDEFGVVIPDEAATAESMDSVDKIVQLIDAYESNAG